MYFISLGFFSGMLSQMVDKAFCLGNVAKVLIILNKKNLKLFKSPLHILIMCKKVYPCLKHTYSCY